jgi:hypothetical protein
VNPQATRTPSFGPSGRTGRKTASRKADLVKVAALERLEALPELGADPRRGRLRELAEPGLLAERLDIAHRKPADERADHHRSQRLRPQHLRGMRKKPRDERLGGLSDLRDLDLQLALEGLHLAGTKAVAKPAPVVAKAPLVVGPALMPGPAQPGVELVFHSPLDDQSRPRASPAQRATRARFSPTPTASSWSIWLSISADGGTVRLTA